MQTFLPHPDYEASARALDRQRLGKQRSEAWQILRALDAADAGERSGWASHPMVRAWRGHRRALTLYGLAICREWRRRGYRDTMLPRFEAALTDSGGPDTPPWLGDERLHTSHRAALLFKDPDWYGQFGWTEAPARPDASGRLPYWWPPEACPAHPDPGHGLQNTVS